VGLIVRVVLCSVSACDNLFDEVKVEGLGAGVLSMVAMMREVLLSAEAVHCAPMRID
jgi:hypothetical protein